MAIDINQIYWRNYENEGHHTTENALFGVVRLREVGVMQSESSLNRQWGNAGLSKNRVSQNPMVCSHLLH